MNSEWRAKYVITLQGKEFVLYAGLLDLATSMGLVSITSTIVDMPNEQNRDSAVVIAVATAEREGRMYSYTGIGDATPRNVRPALATCLLRMAETRAKARALRDLTNVGMASVEELSPDSFDEKVEQKVELKRLPEPILQRVRQCCLSNKWRFEPSFNYWTVEDAITWLDSYEPKANAVTEAGG